MFQIFAEIVNATPDAIRFAVADYTLIDEFLGFFSKFGGYIFFEDYSILIRK